MGQADSLFRSSMRGFAALFLQHIKRHQRHLNMLMAPLPSLNPGKPSSPPGEEDPNSSHKGNSTSTDGKINSHLS